MAGIQKTNAARLLDKAGISYELIPYTVDPDNLAALINEELLASKNGFKKAVDKHKAIKQCQA